MFYATYVLHLRARYIMTNKSPGLGPTPAHTPAFIIHEYERPKREGVGRGEIKTEKKNVSSFQYKKDEVLRRLFFLIMRHTIERQCNDKKN